MPVKIVGGTITGFNRRISLSGGGPVAYGFDYCYAEFPKPGAQTNVPQVMPGQAFPRIGDTTAGTSGLGLTGGAWYWNGFFGVQAGAHNLTRTVAESMRAYTNADRAVMDVEWRPDWATVQARWTLCPKDDKLFMRVAVAPADTNLAWTLVFKALPGHLGAQTGKLQNRWACTAARNIQHHAESDTLNPDKEYWLFLFDSNHNQRGTCALLYVPEEVDRVIVDQRSNYMSGILLHMRPGLREARLLLWHFPDSYLKPEDAYNRIRDDAARYLDELRQFNFE